MIRHLGADELHLDVIPHLFNNFFLGVFLPHLRVDIELPDDLQQPGAGEDLLVEALDALVRITRDRGFDEIRGNLLLLDENGGGGLIDRGESQGHHRGEQKKGCRHPDEIPLPAHQDAPIMSEVLFLLHFSSLKEAPDDLSFLIVQGIGET